MNRIYTAGYQGMKADTLPILTVALNLVVVDVRLNPTSPAPRWRGSALAALLGDRYTQNKQWGNRNFRDSWKGIVIADFEFGWSIFRELRIARYRSGCDFLLLCGCREAEHCHRRTLAGLITKASGEEVQELDWRSEIQRLEIKGGQPNDGKT